jgi:hypothetical protein
MSAMPRHWVRSNRETIEESLRALLAVVAIVTVTAAVMTIAILILKFDPAAFMYD